MNDITSNSASVGPALQRTGTKQRARQLACAQHADREKPRRRRSEQLSAPEDVSQYVEQRLADEGQTEQQASEPKKRLNRYERLRKARDAAQAEAAALRRKARRHAATTANPKTCTNSCTPRSTAAEQQADTNGQQPPEGEGYAQTPEEAAEAREQLKQQMMREQDIAADYRARERAVAAALPDYRETIEAAADIDIGPTAVQLLRESPHGPFIAYGFAKTVDGQEILHALKDADPLEVAKFVAKAEAAIEPVTGSAQCVSSGHSSRSNRSAASPPTRHDQSDI